jgi:hypothetical protein
MNLTRNFMRNYKYMINKVAELGLSATLIVQRFQQLGLDICINVKLLDHGDCESFGCVEWNGS